MHRQTVFRNYGMVAGYAALQLLMLYLIWGGPTPLHCMFHVNCDNHTSMNSSIPVISSLSVSGLGGCFYGPQLHQIGRVPDPKTCDFPDVPRADEVMKTFDYNDNGGYFGAPDVCRGANNCLSTTYKTQLTILLGVMTILVQGSYYVMNVWRSKARRVRPSVTRLKPFCSVEIKD